MRKYNRTFSHHGEAKYQRKIKSTEQAHTHAPNTRMFDQFQSLHTPLLIKDSVPESAKLNHLWMLSGSAD